MESQSPFADFLQEPLKSDRLAWVLVVAVDRSEAMSEVVTVNARLATWLRCQAPTVPTASRLVCRALCGRQGCHTLCPGSELPASSRYGEVRRGE